MVKFKIMLSDVLKQINFYEKFATISTITAITAIDLLQPADRQPSLVYMYKFYVCPPKI